MHIFQFNFVFNIFDMTIFVYILFRSLLYLFVSIINVDTIKKNFINIIIY